MRIHKLHLNVYSKLFKIDKKRLYADKAFFLIKFFNYNIKYHAISMLVTKLALRRK